MNKRVQDKWTMEDIEAAIRHMHQSHEKLNHVVTFVDPRKQLLDVAEGPFHQVPIALKDNVNTKGILTTASSKILSDYVPVYDATITKKLREAGAVVIAKTSLDELGMGGTNLSAATGPVLNPYDLSRISGGSSGGSAVAVASGDVPFAIGSDTGDSVRKPASFCGITGTKPTYGRISRYGIIPYASSLDHVAFFTRNVKDAAIGLGVLAGRDDHDMTSSFLPVDDYENYDANIEGKVFGVLKSVTDYIEDARVLALFDQLLDKLKAKGAIIKEVEIPYNLMKAVWSTYNILSNCEATANHSNLDGLRFGVGVSGESVEEVMTKSRTQGLSFYIRRRFVTGSYGLLQENQEKLFKKAQRVRRLIVEAYRQCFEAADVVLAPASGRIATKLSGSDSDPMSDESLIVENWLVLGNFSGYPSVTLPMGFVDECPIGVNLNTLPFTEKQLFGYCAAVEEVTGYADMVKEVGKDEL
ncbi:MAG: Asp-tRNA(Asn)/Glu-tRNA(Gln) amidotransferase subunit GatA [Erysipelotrichaceae bacterium]|jgi:aspartyl-tRNA(Asn)/glutamyl-tRNA(Gln) amidotransferase subunit A|nr:Asp-tRNA(Asn)/Glu-tRNA(Gln) amidotransferase subunit GatA [Erysipelotrichaceae bacterium]